MPNTDEGSFQRTTMTTEYRVVRPATGERREADSYEDAVDVATTWMRNWSLTADELTLETRAVTAPEWVQS